MALEQEIHALSLYLEIEKVRFDDRLKVDMNVSDEAKEALVPSLILQPLIENSLKYVRSTLFSTVIVHSFSIPQASQISVLVYK